VSRAPVAARELLRDIFDAALAAVRPDAAVARAIARRGEGVFVAERAIESARCVVLAAGKAAHGMAGAWHEQVGAPRAALLVARESAEAPPGWREWIAGHPVPNEASERAGHAALDLAASARGDETLAVLLSGGASALLSAPLPGLTLADLRATTELLLRSGAEIGELNCVRKHLTAASGGRIAAAAGARELIVLAISDVIGDDLATIGSGPCAPDPTTFEDAIAVLRERGIWLEAPERVRSQLERGARGEAPESPKPGDPIFARVYHRILAANRDALAAAEACARERGISVHRSREPLRGEARDVGAAFARRALALRSGQPQLLLAGGETTVTVRGAGRGGRCQELALGAALALAEVRGVTLLAAGTDGSDGPTDAAGAFADGDTIARGRAAGVDAQAALARSNAYAFFASESGLLRTGATGTNALDVVLALVEPEASS
jgi:glycerate-2-kinase